MRHLLEPGDGSFAAQAALLVATKRGGIWVIQARTVDADRARFDLVARLNRSVDVVGEDTCVQSVNRGVRNLNGFTVFFETDDRKDGRENFHVPGNVHFWRDVLEHSRCEVRAVVAFATQEQASTLRDRQCDLFFGAFGGGLVNQWPDLGAGLEWITNRVGFQ